MGTRALTHEPDFFLKFHRRGARGPVVDEHRCRLRVMFDRNQVCRALESAITDTPSDSEQFTLIRIHQVLLAVRKQPI